MTWIGATVVVAAVAAGLNAGAFFAFSNFVMPALEELGAEEGTSAMQSINRFAPNPLFVATIVGAAVTGVPAVVSEWGALTDASRWAAAGVALSTLSMLITITRNVPRNDALAELDATAVATPAAWRDYVTGWTRWNTTRALASAASVVAYAMSIGGS